MTDHMDRFARDTADKLERGLHRQTMGDDWKLVLEALAFADELSNANYAKVETALTRLRAEHAEMAAALRKIAAYDDRGQRLDFDARFGQVLNIARAALARIQGEAP